MKNLILILILSVPAFAQLDYGPKATNKEAAVRMHFAIRLFRGVDKAQEEFLLRGIRDRRSISEVEAKQLFKDELKDIFFGIGREDVSNFKAMYEKEKIGEKKEIWFGLTKEERVDARRINFAWGVGYLSLNDIQIDFLVRFSKELPGITKEELNEFQDEALLTFSYEDGRLLFGSIGPFVKTQCPVLSLQQTNCPCSIGSSFNMSCDGECGSPGGRCTVTAEGCGFAWLYSCSGFCAVS